MRSDAIDQLLSTYLQHPARVSWTGAVGDSIRGVFEGARLELAGVSLLALPFDRLVFESDRFELHPGIPARIQVARPRVEVSIDQAQMDRWIARSRAPFRLLLREEAIEVGMELVGVPLGHTLTELEISRGWLALKPRHTEILGLRSRLAALFRTYLPIPRLAPQTRITAIRHARGAIRFELTLDDFEDEITSGLVDRLKGRFLPFGAFSARPPSDPR